MNSKFNIHHHRSFWWRICCGVAIALSIITFTPFVIGGHASRILYLPYSLTVGLIIALAFIAVTIAGSFLYPKLFHPHQEIIFRDTGIIHEN